MVNKKNAANIKKAAEDIAKAKGEEVLADAAREINFTYTITNDGTKISKKFDGKASPQDVVMTLLSCMIADIKTNLDKSAYEKFLDIIGTQYAMELLPHLLEEKNSKTKTKNK